MQGRLDRRLGRAAPNPPALEPGRNHFGIVDDDGVASPQQIWKLVHATIGKSGFRSRADNQEPRGIARNYRTQRNAFGGQLKIEFVCPHAISYTRQRRRSCCVEMGCA